MRKYTLLIIFVILHLLCQAQGGTWTWIKGNSDIKAGNIGTIGVTDPANYPDSRYGAVHWTDHDGNFWIFGGTDSTLGERNDMWKYDPIANTWTWMNGTLAPTRYGIYGTKGVPAPTNQPGARSIGSASWTDRQGRLWMYGGHGYDGGGSHINGYDRLSDMWMYDIPTNTWTWMQGADTVWQPPSYGTQFVSSPTNTPGSRFRCSASWLGSDGSLWMFGGVLDFGNVGNNGSYNDMWKYDVNTNEWTWMSGGQGPNRNYSYGTLNVPSPSNLPPSRASYQCWQDQQGNFYLFGGVKFDSIRSTFNDLWKYNTNTDLWTWIGGSSQPFGQGLFTQYCVPGNNAIPSSIFDYASTQLTGCSEIFWSFGGIGGRAPTWRYYNDLWNYNTQTNEWTWVSGSNTNNPVGNYGTMGVPAASNMPGARYGACLWTDKAGTLYLWGGQNDYPSRSFNDMWKFEPDPSCLQNQVYLPPLSIHISDSIICSNDSARIIVFGGRLTSITPLTGVSVSDSAHISIAPDSATIYTLIAAGTCPLADTFTFTITPVSQLHTALQQTLCPGDSLIFHSHVIRTYGVYTDTFATAHGCDSIVTLTVDLSLIHTTHITRSICSGDSIIYRGQTIHTAGVYTDTLSTARGCDSIVILTLGVYPKPISSFSIDPLGDSVALGSISVTNTSANTDTALWMLNDRLITLLKNDLLPLTDTDNYCIRLIAISGGGCSDTSQQCIYVFENAFVMPNAFTPNDDGRNDRFYPVFINSNNTAVSAFSIYDRWGQKLFDDPSQGWDGKYKGQSQPGGVYTYFITVNLADTQHPGQMREIHRQGCLTLIR